MLKNDKTLRKIVLNTIDRAGNKDIREECKVQIDLKDEWNSHEHPVRMNTNRIVKRVRLSQK